MISRIEKVKESSFAANETVQRASVAGTGFYHADNRPQSNTRQKQLKAMESGTPVQSKGNKGLPDQLRSGIESLSGISMDDVKVHHNSDKPAQLNAHAYAQGTDIHLAPGQEKHLPHEAWHVVQQKQGRVKPTMQMKGKVNINDNKGLEKEANAMGTKALQLSSNADSHEGVAQMAVSATAGNVFQLRHIGLFGLEAEVLDQRLEMLAFSPEIMPENDPGTALPILKDPNVILEEYSLGTLSRYIKITLDNEAKDDQEDFVRRSFTVEFIQHPVDVLGSKSEIQKAAEDWSKAAAFWKHLHQQKDEQKTLEEKMTDFGEININKKWSGDQFAAHKNSGEITSEGPPEKTVHSLDWTKMTPEIKVESEDPNVSPQLTAGASLLAMDKAYLATNQPLYKSQKFDNDHLKELKIAHSTDENLGSREALSLIVLIERYLKDPKGMKPNKKRYIKEFVPLMTRTSLDSVYAGMSERGQKLFKACSIKYMNGDLGTVMGKRFGVTANSPIFSQQTSKEAHANHITIEQLLLSIMKLKKGNLKGSFDPDDQAAPGDAFSQNNLAGISEINAGNQDGIERFGLSGPGEMMPGVKGIIFENRLAKVIPLSQMATLFVDVAQALKSVEDEFDARRQEHKLTIDASKARSQQFSYRY